MDGFTSGWNGYRQTEHRFRLPSAIKCGGGTAWLTSSLGFFLSGWSLHLCLSNAVLASGFSASAEVSRRGISLSHPHAEQRHPMKESLSAQTNSRFSMPIVYAVRAAFKGREFPNETLPVYRSSPPGLTR